jgi:excisionase family DNA binding protein
LVVSSLELFSKARRNLSMALDVLKKDGVRRPAAPKFRPERSFDRHVQCVQAALCIKPKQFVQMGMNLKSLPLNCDRVPKTAFPVPDEIPLTVRQAAVFLGVSAQTVYLWVERKQIPHLRVMGRNIRFLKSDLEPFRATFKQEVGIAETE